MGVVADAKDAAAIRPKKLSVSGQLGIEAPTGRAVPGPPGAFAPPVNAVERNVSQRSWLPGGPLAVEDFATP
jgi:hypothetical protein